jgi:hypothetical protein
MKEKEFHERMRQAGRAAQTLQEELDEAQPGFIALNKISPGLGDGVRKAIIQADEINKVLSDPEFKARMETLGKLRASQLEAVRLQQLLSEQLEQEVLTLTLFGKMQHTFVEIINSDLIRGLCDRDEDFRKFILRQIESFPRLPVRRKTPLGVAS